MYYFGIDGGGTKSRLVAADGNGKVIGRYEGASTNLASNQAADVAKHIRELVVRFLGTTGADLGDCKGLCIGSAGVDVPENVSLMESILREVGFTCPILAVNDAEIILWAELRARAGVALISGTGSVAYGKDSAGTVIRSGGWGHLLDDEGSGYWMGKEAVRRALMAMDGRGGDTVLIGKLKERFQIKRLEDVVTLIYAKDFRKKDVASLAVLAEEGRREGDPVCRAIVDEAVAGLRQMVCAVVDTLNMGGEAFAIVLSGGNMENNSYMREALSRELRHEYNGATVGVPSQEPVMGAVWLAGTERKGKGE